MISKITGAIFSLLGWSVIGQPPSLNKYVIIVAPHTSNWDFFIFLLLKIHFRLQVRFIGKHTVFWGPLGWFMRKIGGIPVVRSKSHNVVQTIVDEFNTSQSMIFALSPEGTRSFKDHWKTGFYHIAVQAKVPIQTVFLDCRTKQIGFGPLIEVEGDIKGDFYKLGDFYGEKEGFKPELFSTIAYKTNRDKEPK